MLFHVWFFRVPFLYLSSILAHTKNSFTAISFRKASIKLDFSLFCSNSRCMMWYVSPKWICISPIKLVWHFRFCSCLKVSSWSHFYFIICSIATSFRNGLFWIRNMYFWTIDSPFLKCRICRISGILLNYLTSRNIYAKIFIQYTHFTLVSTKDVDVLSYSSTRARPCKIEVFVII